MEEALQHRREDYKPFPPINCTVSLRWGRRDDRGAKSPEIRVNNE
jgi:hypothetical protein